MKSGIFLINIFKAITFRLLVTEISKQKLSELATQGMKTYFVYLAMKINTNDDVSIILENLNIQLNKYKSYCITPRSVRFNCSSHTI